MTAAQALVPGGTRPKWQLWVGGVLSALPVLMMLFSAFMKLSRNPMVIDGMVAKGGFPESSILPIGIVEVLCVVIYVVPQTAVLGAILMTGYLGGAVATHVHGGQSVVMPVLLGVIAWGGLYFRDRRVSDLIPLRKGASD